MTRQIRCPDLDFAANRALGNICRLSGPRFALGQPDLAEVRGNVKLHPTWTITVTHSPAPLCLCASVLRYHDESTEAVTNFEY